MPHNPRKVAEVASSSAWAAALAALSQYIGSRLKTLVFEEEGGFQQNVTYVPKAEDPRDQELIQTHSTLAQAALQQENARVRKTVEEHPELLTPSIQEAMADAQQYVYHNVQVTYAAVVGIFLEARFPGGSFIGGGAGQLAGIGTTWGTAWFNYPLDALRNWEARFEANFYPLTTNVNWWGLRGEYIGSYIGGGVVVLPGWAAGQGKWEV